MSNAVTSWVNEWFSSEIVLTPRLDLRAAESRGSCEQATNLEIGMRHVLSLLYKKQQES